MKRILTLCLLLCIFSVAGAEWEERQCEICGKTVYEWVDRSIVEDTMWCAETVTWLDPPYYAILKDIGGEEWKILWTPRLGIHVCYGCLKKYMVELDDIVRVTRNKWLEKVKAENVGTRKEQDKARREKELIEKIGQIKKLIDEIEVKFSVGGLDKAYCPRALMTDPCDAGSTYTGHKDEIVIDTTVVDSIWGWHEPDPCFRVDTLNEPFVMDTVIFDFYDCDEPDTIILPMRLKYRRTIEK